MAKTEIIEGHRLGLLIVKPECFALALALRELQIPGKAAEIKHRAKTILDGWVSKGIEPLYPIDEKVISLGLRSLGRFGIAVREGRGWKLTEQGQRVVDDAAIPLVSNPPV